MITAFELQTFQGGKWKIDSIFDDRDLVVFEAKRLHESGRFPAVRVVEEIYDFDSDRTVTRTIFKSAKTDRGNAVAARRQKQVESEVQESHQKAEQMRTVKAKKKAQADSNRLYVMLALKTVGIVIVGAAVLIALKYFSDVL